MLFLLFFLQGGDRSSGRPESSIEETAKCIPVLSIIETCVPGAENAVLFQARECKLYLDYWRDSGSDTFLTASAAAVPRPSLNEISESGAFPA